MVGQTISGCSIVQQSHLSSSKRRGAELPSGRNSGLQNFNDGATPQRYLMMWTRQLSSWVPRAYQEQAVKLGIAQACAGFLMSPGMGKTTTIYAIYSILKAKAFCKRVLVIAPLRVAYNVWPTQCHEWAEFDHLKVLVLHGKDKEKNLYDESADICVINPEGLPWLTGAVKFGKAQRLDAQRLAHLRQHFDVLVVDESTKFKDTQTGRFKILRQFVKNFRRRYILTGTFSPNGLLDLFGQVYILDEGASLGAYITHYRNKYFYPTHRDGYALAPHEWAPAAIAEKIAPLCLVLDRHQHLDMPDLLYNDIWVDLPTHAKGTYKLMQDALVAQLEAGTIIAANAAVASSKCRQIANGCIYNENGEYSHIHDEKLGALEDLIESMSGEPLLVAYEFKFDLERIQEKFKAPALGQGSQQKDSDLIMLFNAGKIPVLLGHPASIALGLNLQGSCFNMAWFGLPWNLEQYLQTIDRIYRQGQKSAQVIVHRILARDTLDERVLKVLGDKDKTQGDFLRLLQDIPR